MTTKSKPVHKKKKGLRTEGTFTAPPSSPAWVVEMHEYYRRHGFYRVSDLERILGDPREGVAIQSSDKRHAASHPPK